MHPFRNLHVHLLRRGFAAAQLAVVEADVNARYASLVSRWDQEEFRRTVLFLGKEEASFYEPRDTPLRDRALVVTTLRNSLIEDFASTPDAAQKHGAPGQLLDDDDVRTLTREAIKVLAAKTVTRSATLTGPDVFGPLPQRYPAAWRALSQLSILEHGEVTYEPIAAQPPMLDVDGSSTTSRIAVLSGIDGSMDPNMAGLLRMIQKQETDFAIFPSWKGCTRNPEKLLRVIEFAILHGAAVVTPNYFVSNGYVSARKKLLRPAHHADEVSERLSDLRGLCAKHKQVLKAVMGL